MARRRWTTNQYMARYTRRLERRAFNRMLDEVHHPQSADGTRRCADCVHNASCTKPRKGNHISCFTAVGSRAPQTSAPPEANNSGCLIIVLCLILAPLIAWIIISPNVISIILIVLILFFFFCGIKK